MNLLSIFLFAPPNGKPNSSLSIVFWIAILAVFYFFMIRPQMKRQKDARKFRESLKPGDKIVTIGGIHGRIKEMSDTTVVIETEGGRLRVEKSAISMEAKTELPANS